MSQHLHDTCHCCGERPTANPRSEWWLPRCAQCPLHCDETSHTRRIVVTGTRLTRRREIGTDPDGTPYSGRLIGGRLIGVTPSAWSEECALSFLRRFKVPLNPHARTGAEQDEQGSPIARAQRQARGEYVRPRMYEPTATTNSCPTA